MTPTTTGIAMDIGNTNSRRDLNSSREGSNSRDSRHSRESRDETTTVRTDQQHAQQETYGAAGDAKNSRDTKTCGNIGGRRRFINNSREGRHSMNSIKFDSRKKYKIERLIAVQEGNFFGVLPFFIATNIIQLFKSLFLNRVRKFLY